MKPAADRPAFFQMLMSALALVCGAQVFAQSASPEELDSDMPVPPAFELRRLITLETPRGAPLTLGLDPATLSISAEGVVRYVVVAASASGAMNVMYEGIRCATAEHRVYARHHAAGGWRVNPNRAWQSLYDAMPSKHPLNLARNGVCAGKSANGSPEEIIRALQAPAPTGF